MRRCVCGLMVVGLFLGMAEQGQGQPTYAFTTLDVPGASALVGASATGINDSGKIVGWYASHGFLLDQSSYTRLDMPGSTGNTIASGINASGQIVGYYGYTHEDFDVHGFLLDQGN